MVFHFIEEGTGQVAEVYASNAQKASDVLARHFLLITDDFYDVWKTADGITVYLDEDLEDAMLIQPISKVLYRFKTIPCEAIKHYRREIGYMESGRFVAEAVSFNPAIWEVDY